jgi:hypothetical protein
MSKNRPGLMARAVITVTALGVVAGLAGPVSASAAENPPSSTAAAAIPAVPNVARDSAATQVPETTQAEKVSALSTLGIVYDDTWFVLKDRDLVFKIFDTEDDAKSPLVKAGALQAYRDGDAAATLFIRTSVFDLDKRDKDNYALAKLERDQARKLKQSAASLMAMPVTDQQLDLGYRDFIYDLYRFITGYPKSKAAALDAFGAVEADQKVFLSTGLLTAKRQDQQDAIDADQQKTKEEKQRLADRNARANAAAVVLLTTTDAMLDLTDDLFIRQLLAKAVPGSEVAGTAQTALNSSNPADWKAYIATGIYAADKRDVAIAKAKKAAEDRRVTGEIKAKAENGLMRPRLAAAAAAALAGTDDDVAAFLKDGQYAVSAQSIRATTPGLKAWYVVSAGGDAWITPGDAGANGTAALDSATWKVDDGLADPNCFSLESAQFAGSYLRQNNLHVELDANDGTTAFKNDATWCARAGNNGSGVSLEPKSQPGRFLRHFGAEVYAANNSSANEFDHDWLFKEDSTWTVADPEPKVSTAITSRWYNDDAFRASVGNPKADEVYDANGGAPVRYRDFDHARAYWSSATNVFFVAVGPILDKYKSVGEYKWLMLAQDTTTAPDGIGLYNHFQGGASIYWSPATGAHEVYGAIRNRWTDMGREQSYLGYPTADEAQAGNLRRSTFQHGNIDHDPSTGKTWDYRV